MLKRKVIRTLLNGMSLHRSDDTMMRNGCLTLCQFKIPDDVVSVKKIRFLVINNRFECFILYKYFFFILLILIE